MSFFKEFKDDLSQAVNELMPGKMSWKTSNRLIPLRTQEL